MVLLTFIMYQKIVIKPAWVGLNVAVCHLHMQKKKQTEEKAKVVAAVWETFLNATLTIWQQG